MSGMSCQGLPVHESACHRPLVEFKRLVTDGISTDIYLAYEAHDIFRQIGERAQLAGNSAYQPMLVALEQWVG